MKKLTLTAVLLALCVLTVATASAADLSGYWTPEEDMAGFLYIREDGTGLLAGYGVTDYAIIRVDEADEDLYTITDIRNGAEYEAEIADDGIGDTLFIYEDDSDDGAAYVRNDDCHERVMRLDEGLTFIYDDRYFAAETAEDGSVKLTWL